MNAATASVDRISLAGAEQVAKVGTWQWCPETEELRWSDNLFRLHGLEPGEVTPGRRALMEMIHPDDWERVERWADLLRRAEIPSPIDFRIVVPTGEIRYLRSTVAAIETDGVNAPLMVGMIQDVTAARRAEREIASRFAVTSALAAWESFE